MPTASLMNCDVTESSSLTTARFPPSSISVLVVRAQPGVWGTGEAASDCGEELGVEDRNGELRVGDKEGLGMGEAPMVQGNPNLIHPCPMICARLFTVFPIKYSMATCVCKHWPCQELGPHSMPVSNSNWVCRCPAL